MITYTKLIYFILVFHMGYTFKILTIPISSGFNSRLLNMQKIADILAEDGHQVSVLMNNRVKNHVTSKYAKVLEYYAPESIPSIQEVDVLSPEVQDPNKLLQLFMDIELAFCQSMMKDKDIWKTLEEENFDLIFTDAQSLCSYAVISALNKTSIMYLNVLVHVYPQLLYPMFPSFVCTLPGLVCRDEDMTFYEKIKNYLFYYAVYTYFTPYILSQLEKWSVENELVLKIPIQNAFRNRVVVINSNYALDIPIPTMPNVFRISGLFHKEPSPLKEEFQKIIEASQPHGVILLSFGTLMTDFDSAKADMFAKVLGCLPHQVIWRFTGKPPKSLKSNTHLVNWIPQNDLLASPSMKLFITHCGISSTFESSLHGVPVLTMPLFGDQEGNAVKLTKKLKMGISLDFYSVTEELFQNGIKEVLFNPIYKENAKAAAFLLNDHVVSPQHQLRHLVNFTMKSGGAPHLFHPYAQDMNLFQFYGLDVIMFLLLVITTILGSSAYLLKLAIHFLCNCLSRNKMKRE